MWAGHVGGVVLKSASGRWRTAISVLMVLVAIPVIVLARSQLVDRTVVVHSAQVSESGTVVEVLFTSGAEGCGEVDRVEWVETIESVTVTVYVSYTLSLGSQACPPIGRDDTARRILEMPLGDRPVIDGSTGRSVPLGSGG